MAHAHYVVLFAGLIFGKNPAANDRRCVTAAKPRDWKMIEPATTRVERSAAKLFGVSPFLAWGGSIPAALELWLVNYEPQ
jgi:hypothetical protein